MKIPRKVKIGGQIIEVTQPEKLEDGKLGRCCIANGYIKIAKTFMGLDQSETSRENTFWHEITHAILGTMGRDDLSGDEVFVSCFAGFLNECYQSMEEDWKNEVKE